MNGVIIDNKNLRRYDSLYDSLAKCQTVEWARKKSDHFDEEMIKVAEKVCLYFDKLHDRCIDEEQRTFCKEQREVVLNAKLEISKKENSETKKLIAAKVIWGISASFKVSFELYII